MSKNETNQQTNSKSGNDGLSAHSLDRAELQTIREYGITCTFLPRYRYGKYRYTNLEDAVAEARRDRASLSAQL